MLKVSDEASLDSNKINIDEVLNRIGDDVKTPFQNSFLQECGYMNILIETIVADLFSISLAFKGELTLTGEMEDLMNAIFLNKVPPTWEKLAFPSMRGLNSWLDNVKQRLISSMHGKMSLPNFLRLLSSTDSSTLNPS